MSSILAVNPSSQDFDFTRSQSTAGRCSADRPPHSSDVYEQGVPSWFQGGLPTPPRTKDMTGVSLNSSHATYNQPQQYTTNYSNGQVPQPYQSHSRAPSDSYLNGKQSGPRSSSIHEFSSIEKNKVNIIASHLQIPESVNKSKGSLAEFAAEITCLFWFESAATLEYAEKLPMDIFPDRGLVTDAAPSFGFKKWVTTILSTTQVGKNVILLALMFIYRLKKFNPSVSGKRGSEFRLLTIALMLGNKFLDDNTYTNKTWAEVSGISVTEIHIMEVEFLSNMRYELYASEDDWASWKALLGKFGSFYEKASRFQFSQHDDYRSNHPVTPTTQTFNYKLPSPPSTHLTSSITTNYSTLSNPLTTLPHLPRSPVRQYVPNGALSERKRSLDPTESLPPAKRIQYYMAPSNTSSVGTLPPSPVTQLDSTPASLPLNQTGPFGGNRIPQLPVPRLPVTAASSVTHLAPLALPSSRAMASVYPPTTAPSWPQPATPISAVPPTLNGQYQNGVIPVSEGTRSNAGSAHTSPVNLYGSATPTRQGLSPSYFLTNRSSPYRPVRNVSTLLIPPPSAAMQSSVRNVGYEQMHYQPLGRPSERRSGPVPYYQPDGWNHSNASTPTTTLYRPF